MAQTYTSVQDTLEKLRLRTSGGRGVIQAVSPDLVIDLSASGQGKLRLVYDWITSGITFRNGVPYYAGTDRPVSIGDHVRYMRLTNSGPVIRHSYHVELDVDETLHDTVVRTLMEDLGQDIEPIRVPDDELTMQIGCVRLMVPATFVKVERIASTQYIPVLRSRGSIKKNAGRTDTRINIQIIYPDEESINDPENGLRALIAMFRRTPFVPIYNRHLNLNEDIWAVCLHDLQVTTIAGFPRSLLVELVLLEFDWSVYLLDFPDFGSAINWPLFNWYVRRGLLDTNGRLKPARFGGPDVIFEYVPVEKLEQAAAQVRQLESGQLRRDVVTIEARYRKAKADVDTVQQALARAEELVRMVPEDLPGMRVLVTRFEYETFNEMLEEHRRLTGEDGLVLDTARLLLTPASQRLFQKMLRHLEYLRQELNPTRERYHTALHADVEIALATEPWPLAGSVTVTAVQAGVQNYFARLPVQSRPKPVYQYLGSTDHRIQMSLTVDDEGLRSLQELFSYCQTCARRFHAKLSTGFLKIRNAITDLFGIEHVLIEAMISETIPGFPGHYHVELTMVDYDQYQTARMRGVFLTKSDEEYIIKVQEGQELPGSVVFGLENQQEWIKAEKVFPLIDCYPDLDLPTWEEVADYLSRTTGRIVRAEDINTNGGYYADPDFYFYRSPVSNREIAEGSVQERSVLLSLDGKKINFDRRQLQAAVLRLVGQGPGALSQLDIPTDQFQVQGKTLDQAFVDEPNEARPQFDREPKPEEGEDDAPVPSSDQDLFRRAFHDYLHYNYQGRMIRAFPTFHMFIVDEGGWVRHRRLWDNFYGFNAVSSIEVHHSRLMATGTCTIELANAQNFIRPGRDTYYKPEAKVFRIDWDSLLWLSIDYDMIRQRQSLPDKIFLRPGARLHLRLGYGNNLADLPIVFNGTITDVQYGEIISLVAQTDARELVEPIFFDPNQVASGLFGGHYPRAFLLRLLLFGSSGFFGRIAQHVRYTIWPEPVNGVIHFGNPEQKLFRRKHGELGQNIYHGMELADARTVSPWSIFTGEFRVPIHLYQKSIWDIGEILAAAVPNFVFAVRPFELRSTVFYGKPWWDWAYGYEVIHDPRLTPEFLETLRRSLEKEEALTRMLAGQNWWMSQEEVESIARQIADVDRQRSKTPAIPGDISALIRQGWRPGVGFWVRERKKTFSQWHIYTSVDSILSNEIRLSADIYNNVIGIYGEDHMGSFADEQSIMVRADPDIYMQFQRGKVIHTELFVEGTWIPLLKDLQSYIFGNFARTVAMNIAGAALRDSMKDMYQGELTVIGDPTVWPHDTMYIADLHKDMTGTCFVKEVYHHFSLDTGFVTVVSPDLACAIKDREAFRWLSLVEIALGLSFFTFFRASIIDFFKRILVKANEGVIRRILGLDRAQQLLTRGATALRSAGQLLRSLGQWAARMRGVSTLVRAGSYAARALPALGAVASSVPILLPALLLSMPMLVLGYSMIREGLRRWNMADRMLVCNFLTYKGGEFSTMVDGASQLTVAVPELATQPTFLDELIDFLPLHANYRTISAEELFGPFGHMYNDEAIRTLLNAGPDIQERLQHLQPEEISVYSSRQNSSSPIVRVALLHVGLPYRPGGRDAQGLDAKGLLASILSALNIPAAGDSLEDLVGTDHFYQVFSGDTKDGDILLLDRDGNQVMDQVVIVLDAKNGYGMVVLDHDFGLGTGVRIINYEQLYRDVRHRRRYRYLEVST